MEKTILSIDFDIVMHPCIELYNDDVEGEDNPEELWNFLENKYNFEDLNLLKYDDKLVIQLIQLLKYNKNKPIYFIQEHQEIVDILKKSPTYKEDKYNIINIDFHHDLWYNEESFQAILQDDEYNCANWLGYLLLKKKLISASWVKASNSIPPRIKTYGNNIQLNTLYFKDLEKLYQIDFDEIYFCLSPQWVPPKYQIIYEIIKLLLT